MWKLGVLLSVALSVAGCQQEEGCATDQDCKGARVCDPRIRLCVDPSLLAPDLPEVPDLGATDAAALDGRPGDDLRADECVGPLPAQRQFAASAIRLPTSMMGQAIDIDGDGRADNQLKAIIGAISSANFDLQAPIDAAVQNGELLLLVEIQAADLVNGCAEATLAWAKRPPAPPKFDGTDVLTADPGRAKVTLRGRMTGGTFSSILPKDQRGADVKRFALDLPLGMGRLPLTVHGVHFQGTVAGTALTGGQIHGVILKTDIDGQIIPAIAQLLTEQIHRDPMGSTTETIIKLFEDPMGNPASRDKCMNTPAKCCAPPANRATTCEILAEEVRTNALIGNVLAPDVQVFQAGVWSPVPKGMMKDAMSMGVGLTGVKATWR